MKLLLGFCLMHQSCINSHGAASNVVDKTHGDVHVVISKGNRSLPFAAVVVQHHNCTTCARGLNMTISKNSLGYGSIWLAAALRGSVANAYGRS